MPEELMMTEAPSGMKSKRSATISHKAGVPDKSGELLTQEGAQRFSEETISRTNVREAARVKKPQRLYY
jgi:hypothetical protein